MTIEKSREYKTDVAARRLFGRMHRDLVELGTQIENVLTGANAMRLALASATLSLAEAEALQVKMSSEKRTNDAILYEAQTRLSELLDAAKVKAASVNEVIGKQLPGVERLVSQAKRMSEVNVIDNEPMGPLPGMEYVEINYFAGALACSHSHVRNLVQRGELPTHDAVTTENSDRPKFLWLKHHAAVAVHKVKSNGKKGIAALV